MDIETGTIAQLKALGPQVRDGRISVEQLIALMEMVDEKSLDRRTLQNLVTREITYDQTIARRWHWEEVPSTYGYPQSYRLGGAVDEVALLTQQWGGVNFDSSHVVRLASGIVVPREQGMDGLIIVPKPSVLAKICRATSLAKGKEGWPDMNLGLLYILDALKHKLGKKFHDFTEGRIGPSNLRMTERQMQALQKLEASQPGDLLLFPGQTGLLYRGKSVRRARALFLAKEFGLGAYITGAHLLVHLERLVKYEDLWMDCAGDEYDFEAGGTWDRAPVVYFYDGKLGFGTGHVDDPSEYYGSVSGFLPE
ncbi:hypothetical protein EXS71_04530 [Candidatus Uhrbacteria bacterium]|nr:hypothetical protein [Candidatus Uhrbacteria bacterium]